MPRGVYDRSKSKKRNVKLNVESMVAEMRAKKAVSVPVGAVVGVTISLPTGKSHIKLTRNNKVIGTFIVDEGGCTFLKSSAKSSGKGRSLMRWSTLAALFNAGLE